MERSEIRLVYFLWSKKLNVERLLLKAFSECEINP